MIYGNLTSPEIVRLAPDHIAVLPLAAIEQHGAHLPVITDTALVSEVTRRAELALKDQILLLPALWAGSSHHHIGFPGTVSIRSETYIQVLCDLVDSLLSAGFRKIVLVNGHGGNITPAAEALYRTMLKQKKGELPWVVATSYWSLPGKTDYREFMESPKLTHACEFETSMMLGLRTDWVNMDKARGERVERNSQFYDPLGYTPSRVMVSESFEQMTSLGAMGKPELATPEKGERLFELYSRALIEFLAEFSTWEHRIKE